VNTRHVLRALRLALLVLMAVGSAASPARAQPPPAPAESPEASIAQAERALHGAIAARDANALGTLVSETFASLDGAPSTRDGWMARLQERCGAGSTEVRQLEIAVRDEVAVASYEATTTRDGPCEPRVVDTRDVDIWQREGSSWRLTFRASTAAAATARAPATPPAPLVPRRLTGSAELNVLATRGNVNTVTVGTAVDTVWQTGAWRTNARASFLRTTDRGLERGRAVNVRVQESRALSSVVELFARSFYQRDLFAGILRRYGADTGVTFVASQAPQRLQTSFGVGSTSEARVNSPSVTIPVVTSGLQYRLALGSDSTLTEEALVTASLAHRSDFRVDSTVALTTVVRRPISLRATYQTRYVHTPVPGFMRFDSVLSVSLLTRF
jgi:putative salt-induced outer membrane protein YdiY